MTYKIAMGVMPADEDIQLENVLKASVPCAFCREQVPLDFEVECLEYIPTMMANDDTEVAAATMSIVVRMHAHGLPHECLQAASTYAVTVMRGFGGKPDGD